MTTTCRPSILEVRHAAVARRVTGRAPLRMASQMAVAALMVTACGNSGLSAEPASGEPSGTLTVLAAASLTETFTALEAALEARFPDLDVAISFGPSSGLVEQVMAGAPADVLATANTVTMDSAADRVIDGEPVIFAQNRLALAVPAGNPGNVTGLADLAREELRVALCEPQVPCGTAAAQLLDIAGVEAAADTLENDVKAVTGKVALGEVDAALTYRTDAAADPDAIETVPFPEADQVVNDYPVAALAAAPNPVAAGAFIAALTGAMGQGLMAEAGFVTP